LLDDAFRAHYPLIDIYQDLLAPAMAMIGNWWKVSAIDEAQEHMASEITQRIMARASHVAGPMRRSGQIAVLGCAPNCWHVIGLRMISDYLRMHGWKTLFLGANVPLKSFVTTVHNHQPQLVLLSVNSPEGIGDTLSTIRVLAESRTKKIAYEIGVGGIQATNNPDEFLGAGANFVATDLKQFAAEILPRLDNVPRV
jgi:methanogenic corrinoid protein MtbC1